MSDSAIPGYRILKKVGRGGMATVFIAIQEAVGRTVALKILPKKLCKDPSFSTLFLQEANCGVLNHPNIITIYDAGETGSHLYIAMEYLQNGDLKQRLKTRISQEETISIITKISEALAYAHSKGFIHRDIKPGNIIFNEDKQPVLADFGIARAISFSDKTVVDGMLLGTPHYTSPEQASSDKVDHRTDLYSLGVVYYEILTGKKPFIADTPFSLIYKHLEEPPPRLASQFKDHQPVIHKLMAKKPDDRYASAFDLIEDLAKLTRAKKEQTILRNARMRTYKSAAVLLTLVLAFSVIVSDRLSNYTEKKFTQIKAIAVKSPLISQTFWGKLEDQRQLTKQREIELLQLKKGIQKNKIISEHLEKAALYLRMNQLINPINDSALSEYALVLSIDSDNTQALSGINMIANNFYLLAKNERLKGAYFDALDYIDSGLIASPDNSKLLNLRNSIVRRMDLSEKRMKLENELLLVKNLIKYEKYEEAIEKLEFLQTISKNNRRILSLLDIAQSHLNQANKEPVINNDL